MAKAYPKEFRDDVVAVARKGQAPLSHFAIISVVLVVALLVDQDPLGVILILSGTITFCFVLSFTVLAPPAPDASLWPIGATLICMAALIGCSILAVTVTTARRSLSRAGIR